MQQITLHIDGMMCTHCTGRVEKALNDLPGVEGRQGLPGLLEGEDGGKMQDR